MRYPFQHLLTSRSILEWACAFAGFILILLALYLANLLLVFVHESLHPWFNMLPEDAVQAALHWLLPEVA
jgi:hypothetical protein